MIEENFSSKETDGGLETPSIDDTMEGWLILEGLVKDLGLDRLFPNPDGWTEGEESTAGDNRDDSYEQVVVVE